MKILFVNRMLGVSWGGGENYDYHLARGLARRGHEVVFLTGRWKGAPYQPPADIECVAVETPYLRRYMYRLGGKVPLLPGLIAEADLRIFFEKSKQSISELVTARGMDRVQILALPYLARWVAGRWPAAMRFPGPPAWFQSGLLRQLGRERRFRMFTHGDAVRYFREQVGTEVAEIAPGINRAIFRPPSPAERAEARTNLELAPDDFALTTVGRLIAGKGHEFLLSALGRMQNPRLRVVVVGDGPRRAEFEALASAHGLAGRVRFTGQAGAGEVARHLWASDAFCLLSSYENYSNAALEAMECGLPVIASDRGGFPQQITEGRNGHLVAYDDHEGLNQRVRELIDDPERRSRLAAGARQFAERFSWDQAARQVEELYAEMEA